MIEAEIRGTVDHSGPGFTNLLPDFKIAYNNRVRVNIYKSLEYSLKHLKPYFSGLKIRHIVPAIIEQYKAARLAEGAKKRTINMELSALLVYISWINETTGSDYPRSKKIGKKEIAPDKPQVLTIEETCAIMAELNGDSKNMIALMGSCGLRKGEVLRLTSAQIDQAGQCICGTGNGGKWRMVPVADPQIMAEISQREKEHPTGSIFISPRTDRARVNAGGARDRRFKSSRSDHDMGKLTQVVSTSPFLSKNGALRCNTIIFGCYIRFHTCG